jgi:hypothetical protein
VRLDLVVHGPHANPWEKRCLWLHEESDPPVTPARVCEKFPELKASEISGIEVTIEGDGTMLAVEDFAFCILRSVTLAPLKIDALRVGKCRDYCKLVSMCLGRLDADESNLLLAACEIRELNVGLKTHQQKFLEGSVDGIQDMRPLTVDIRESQIAKARICVPLRILDIEGTTVSRISIESPVEVMEIAHDSELTRMTILDSIGHLDLTHSVVGNLYLHAPIQELNHRSSNMCMIVMRIHSRPNRHKPGNSLWNRPWPAIITICISWLPTNSCGCAPGNCPKARRGLFISCWSGSAATVLSHRELS